MSLRTWGDLWIRPLAQRFLPGKVASQRLEQRLRGNALFLIDELADRGETVGDVGHLNGLYAGEVVVRAAERDVAPEGHAIVDHRGEEGRGQAPGVHLVHHGDQLHHFVGVVVDLFGEGRFQFLIGFVGGEIAVIRADDLTGEQVDAAGERQFQRLDEVEHRRVGSS